MNSLGSYLKIRITYMFKEKIYVLYTFHDNDVCRSFRTRLLERFKNIVDDIIKKTVEYHY